MKFYLAGPYSERARLADMAGTIERASGWVCTSTWLSGAHDECAPEQAAEDDVADVREARALVIDATRSSTRGGMWVEFGIALERGMPIVVVAPFSARLTVFAFLPGVTWRSHAEPAAAALVQIGRRLGDES